MVACAHVHEAQRVAEKFAQPLRGSVAAVVGDHRVFPDRDFARTEVSGERHRHGAVAGGRQRERPASEGSFDQRHARVRALREEFAVSGVHDEEATVADESVVIEFGGLHAEAAAGFDGVEVEGGEMHGAELGVSEAAFNELSRFRPLRTEKFGGLCQTRVRHCAGSRTHERHHGEL